MAKKITLVTGGTGFIGSHLVEALLGAGREVRVLALKEPFEKIEEENLELIKEKGAEIIFGDLLNKDSLVPALENVDTIFHLGGISRPMKILSKSYYDTNVEGTRNLFSLAKEIPLKRFVHVSTVSVLGLSPDGHPLKEDEFQYDDLQYGLSKREGEHVALEHYFRYDVPAVVIRPSLVYGPRCLVRKIMFKYVKMGVFPLINGGIAHMEFAYVDNIVQALLLAEKADNVLGEVFNVTDGQSYEIREVLGTIASVLGVASPSINIPTAVGRLGGYLAEFICGLLGIYPPFSSTAADWMSNSTNVYDCTKAKEVLGYNPKVTLKEGIKNTALWFKERGDI